MDFFLIFIILMSNQNSNEGVNQQRSKSEFQAFI